MFTSWSLCDENNHKIVCTGISLCPGVEEADVGYLRSNVVWCSTEGFGGDAVMHVFFTHAEVRYLNVTLAVQHHVVQLQVPTEKPGHHCATRCEG